MKRVYFTLLTCFTLNHLNAATYLRNNYGAAIQYVKTTPEMVAKVQPGTYPATTIGNGMQVEMPLTPYLSISSVGGSYYDISYIFKDILVHKVNHLGEDAVIVIYPRQGLSGIYNWNITLEWETPESMPTFSKKQQK
jgi:hypothetical protein